MNNIEKCNLAVGFPGATSATAATAATIIDTLGCSKAHIYVLNGSAVSTSAVYSNIDVYHGTNSAATTLISAASWATVASTAAANVLPTLGLNSGSVVEIHLNLADKGRYINVLTTRGATPAASAIGGVFVLLEPEISADTTAQKAVVNLGANTHSPLVGTVNA